MKNETKAEKKIKGPELEVAIILSIPEFSHTGTRIMAPPNPKDPPITPAASPDNMQFQAFLVVILFSTLTWHPSLSFCYSVLWIFMATDFELK